MTDFVKTQLRCRELEHRIGHLHEISVGKHLPTHRLNRLLACERKLVSEWERLKRAMAHAIYEERR